MCTIPCVPAMLQPRHGGIMELVFFHPKMLNKDVILTPGYKADIWKHGECCEKTTVPTIEISAYELNWTRRPWAARFDKGYLPSTWWYWLNRDQLVSDLLVATWQALTWLWSIFAESTFVIYIIYIVYIYIPHARCRLLTSTRYTVFQQSKNA